MRSGRVRNLTANLWDLETVRWGQHQQKQRWWQEMDSQVMAAAASLEIIIMLYNNEFARQGIAISAADSIFCQTREIGGVAGNGHISKGLYCEHSAAGGKCSCRQQPYSQPPDQCHRCCAQTRSGEPFLPVLCSAIAIAVWQSRAYNLVKYS